MQRRGRSSSLPAISMMLCSWLFLTLEGSAQSSPPSNCLIPDYTRAVLNMPLVPDHETPGAPGFTLTINGTGVGGSAAQVFWNSVSLNPTGGNWSQATATVPSSLLARAGTVAVTVQNSTFPS